MRLFAKYEATSGAEQALFGLVARLDSLRKYIPMADDQKFSISGGLVEIAALTALIGGATAESLALGTRGAAGLPWAALSSFGSIFLVKACVAASTPAWLRETIGVRTAGSDGAVGCAKRLDARAKGGRMSGEPVGIMVECDKENESAGSSIRWDTFEEVYAFDEWTGGPLRSCAALDQGEHLRAHFYMRDPQWAPLHRSLIKADWLYTASTLTKVVEMYLLYHYGSFYIYWITGVSWAYFFLGAVILQLFGLSRALPSDKQHKCVDLVAGKLPTPQIAGGQRGVLLDVPINVRKHLIWRGVWTGGSFICVGSLIATYVVLSKEPALVFQIWLTFQILWLALRSLFFHFASRTDSIARIITPVITEKYRPAHLNFRLLGLSTAISKYQILNHPRGAYCYADDAQDPTIIKALLDDAGMTFLDHLPLPENTAVGSILDMRVIAVLGDTMLSSAAWLIGSPLTGMDLYDSCILILRCASQNKTLLVPACRVLSGRIDLEESLHDPELTASSQFLPKGVSNSGKDISWWYWIPCGGDTWLHYHTPWATAAEQRLGVTGKREMMVTSSEEITETLRHGELMVSLNGVKDVESVLEKSVAAAGVLREMMLGAPAY